MPNRSLEIAVRYLYNGFSISRGNSSRKLEQGGLLWLLRRGKTSLLQGWRAEHVRVPEVWISPVCRHLGGRLRLPRRHREKAPHDAVGRF